MAQLNSQQATEQEENGILFSWTLATKIMISLPFGLWLTSGLYS